MYYFLISFPRHFYPKKLIIFHRHKKKITMYQIKSQNNYKLRIVNIISIQEKIFIQMGVCMASCTKGHSYSKQIVTNDMKQQIENQLHENQPFKQQLNLPQKQIQIHQSKVAQKLTQSRKSFQPQQPVTQNQNQSIHSGEQNVDAEGYQASQKQETNNQYAKLSLYGKGKTEKDNQLIKKSLDSPEPVKLQKIYFDNGFSYEGEWLRAMKHGQGTQWWSDGSYYSGDWKFNKASGNGTLNHADGDVYEGEWENDKPNGIGKYKHSNGVVYEGSWKDDKQHGKGVEIWPNGQKYQGQYNMGVKEGKGILKFNDASFYQGDFLNNQIHGKGTYTWFQNRKYIGDWRNNKMHGKGRVQWADGKTYEGDYQNDRKHGFGTFCWPDGRKYVGLWKDGKQHGRGQYFLPDKSKKIGQWVEGKRIKWLQQ